MQKSSWFLKASAAGTLALIMSAAALGGNFSAEAFATPAATAAATAAAAPNLPMCYTAAGTTKLRVVHVSPNSPAVDIYLDLSATAKNPTPAIKGLAYGKATDYVTLPKGTHEVTVVATGTSPTVVKNVLFDAQYALKGKNAYTLSAEGTVAGKNFIVKPHLDDASDTAGMVRVVVVHAILDGPSVDVLAGGTPVIQGLTPGATTELNIPAPAKPVDIVVTAAGDPKTVILTLKNTTLVADTIYTVYATGLVGSKTVPAVPFKAVVLTSASIAGYPAPATPTPAPVATTAATAAAAPAPAATAAAAAPVATVAATLAPTTVPASTAIPKGSKPANIGMAVKTSNTYRLLSGAKCFAVTGITVPGGPADVAGLKSGQLILGVDGKAVANIADFQSIIQKHASGDVITLVIQDPATGTESYVPVTLGANPFSG